MASGRGRVCPGSSPPGLGAAVALRVRWRWHVDPVGGAPWLGLFWSSEGSRRFGLFLLASWSALFSICIGRSLLLGQGARFSTQRQTPQGSQHRNQEAWSGKVVVPGPVFPPSAAQWTKSFPWVDTEATYQRWRGPFVCGQAFAAWCLPARVVTDTTARFVSIIWRTGPVQLISAGLSQSAPFSPSASAGARCQDKGLTLACNARRRRTHNTETRRRNPARPRRPNQCFHQAPRNEPSHFPKPTRKQPINAGVHFPKQPAKAPDRNATKTHQEGAPPSLEPHTHADHPSVPHADQAPSQTPATQYLLTQAATMPAATPSPERVLQSVYLPRPPPSHPNSKPSSVTARAPPPCATGSALAPTVPMGETPWPFMALLCQAFPASLLGCIRRSKRKGDGRSQILEPQRCNWETTDEKTNQLPPKQGWELKPPAVACSTTRPLR